MIELTQGSLALQDYGVRRTTAPRRNNNKIRRQNKRKLMIILGIVIFFAACMLMCYRYVAIAGQVAQYAMLEEELVDLQARNIQLTLEIESAVNTREIEEYGANVLGMTKPQRYQIVYITPQAQGTMGKIAKNPAN